MLCIWNKCRPLATIVSDWLQTKAYLRMTRGYCGHACQGIRPAAGGLPVTQALLAEQAMLDPSWLACPLQWTSGLQLPSLAAESTPGAFLGPPSFSTVCPSSPGMVKHGCVGPITCGSALTSAEQAWIPDLLLDGVWSCQARHAAGVNLSWRIWPTDDSEVHWCAGRWDYAWVYLLGGEIF